MFFKLKIWLKPELWAAGIISTIYPLPVHKTVLRQVPYLKLILIAMCWALVACVDVFSYLPNKTFLLLPQAFFFVLAITIPFDLRDEQADLKSGLKTLANTSQKRTLYILCSALILVWILIDFRLENNIKESLFIGAIVLFLIFYALRKPTDIRVSFFLEGASLIPLIIHLLL